MATLVLVRHGQSTWNAVDAWTGLINISLDEKGREAARNAGVLIKDIKFDFAFTSKLIRAQQTLDEIKDVIDAKDLPTSGNAALNERDYGDLTGKNKFEIKKDYGEEQWMKWRRSWDSPLPNGESLKDVYTRTIPYFEQEILPKLIEGKNVLIVAHGNSLRALTKYLENISNEDIENLEIPTGQVIVYQIDPSGKIASKEIKRS